MSSGDSSTGSTSRPTSACTRAVARPRTMRPTGTPRPTIMSTRRSSSWRWPGPVVDTVPDMQRVLRERCEAHGTTNVEILAASAAELPDRLPPQSVDSAFLIQSLHHMHRRAEVFEVLGRVVRTGGRLLVVEPHHNLRRIARLGRKWVKHYRARDFWSREEGWATHDFLTRGELRDLCRHGGFDPPRISGYWIPYMGRLVPDPAKRFRLESRLGRFPIVRHWAGVLAIETHRS